MAINRDFRDLLQEFCDREVRFLVVGAHAVIFYSVPRYTKDLDLWVAPAPENARRAYDALSVFGAPLHELTVGDLETPGTIFQIGVEPNRIDILTSIDGVEFDEAWASRETSTYGGVPISILSRAHLMVAKRRAGRPQDLLDLEWLRRSESENEAPSTS